MPVRPDLPGLRLHETGLCFSHNAISQMHSSQVTETPWTLVHQLQARWLSQPAWQPALAFRWHISAMEFSIVHSSASVPADPPPPMIHVQQQVFQGAATTLRPRNSCSAIYFNRHADSGNLLLWLQQRAGRRLAKLTACCACCDKAQQQSRPTGPSKEPARSVKYTQQSLTTDSTLRTLGPAHVGKGRIEKVVHARFASPTASRMTEPGANRCLGCTAGQLRSLQQGRETTEGCRGQLAAYIGECQCVLMPPFGAKHFLYTIFPLVTGASTSLPFTASASAAPDNATCIGTTQHAAPLPSWQHPTEQHMRGSAWLSLPASHEQRPLPGTRMWRRACSQRQPCQTRRPPSMRQ